MVKSDKTHSIMKLFYQLSSFEKHRMSNDGYNAQVTKICKIYKFTIMRTFLKYCFIILFYFSGSQSFCISSTLRIYCSNNIQSTNCDLQLDTELNSSWTSPSPSEFQGLRLRDISSLKQYSRYHLHTMTQNNSTVKVALQSHLNLKILAFDKMH